MTIGALPVSSGGAPFVVNKSLRLNNGYLARTPSVAGNRKTWTFSTWIKPSRPGLQLALFAARQDASNYTSCYLNTDGTIILRNIIAGVSTHWLWSNTTYRDYSAWYHIVFAVNTSSETTNSRARIWVNNVEGSSWLFDNRASIQNVDTFINDGATVNYIGVDVEANATSADYYATEINFVDGQALTPSAFGKMDNKIGAWQPKNI